MEISKIKIIQKHIPVILGAGINAYGIVRSFSENGIYSIVIETRKNFCFYSSYVCGMICPDPSDENKFIDFLIKLGKELDNPGIIFTTNDKWLLPVCDNMEKLKEHYLIPMSPPEITKQYVDKNKLYDIAENAGLDFPNTFEIPCITELKTIIDKIIFPCILKPAITLDFSEKLLIKKRVIYIDNREQLLIWAEKIKTVGLEKKQLILQEYVPGSTENLFTITTYSDKKGDIKAYSTGHKLRQRPPDAGTIISGKVIHEPRLFELAQKLLKSPGFYGIANTEFKYDKRDDKFKLIEINPRPGKWTYSATATGINFPLMAYYDILNIEYNHQKYSKKSIIWLCFFEDLYNSVLGGFKRAGYPEFSMSFTKYFKSIGGKKYDAVLNSEDMLPGIMYLLNLFFKIGK